MIVALIIALLALSAFYKAIPYLVEGEKPDKIIIDKHIGNIRAIQKIFSGVAGQYLTKNMILALNAKQLSSYEFIQSTSYRTIETSNRIKNIRRQMKSSKKSISSPIDADKFTLSNLSTPALKKLVIALELVRKAIKTSDSVRLLGRDIVHADLKYTSALMFNAHLIIERRSVEQQISRGGYGPSNRKLGELLSQINQQKLINQSIQNERAIIEELKQEVSTELHRHTVKEEKKAEKLKEDLDYLFGNSKKYINLR